MNRTPSDWKISIAKLKPGLTIAQASKQLGVGYGYTIKLCKRRYEFKRQPRSTDHSNDKLKLTKADRNLNHAEVGLKYGVSREWVRQVRRKAGMDNVNGRKYGN